MGYRLSRFLTRAVVVKTVLVLTDSSAVLFSIALALALRFDDLPWQSIYQRFLHPHVMSLPLVLACYIGAYSRFRLYRYAWRFVSVDMLWGIIYANTTALVGLVVIQWGIDSSVFPRSVLVLMWAASIAVTGCTRVLLRSLSIARRYGRQSVDMIRRDRPDKRVVILGAGADGARILRAVREDPALNYAVVGFLDDDPRKKGTYVSSVKVLGPPTLLKRLSSERRVDEVIVALPEGSSEKVRECIMECRRRKLPVKVVPQVRDVLIGKTSLQLVDFSVEDLLRRPPADTNVAVIGGYLTGKRVLVTGAGGSIGSEMCRQIASLDPEHLILLGHGENSIHQIYQELRQRYPSLRERFHYAIASVAHEHRLYQVFQRYNPDVVFHAAAHKHVPIMETNEEEAVINNVVGTFNVARACGQAGVERVVLISTDKAAAPVCIMGATKWICEEVFRAAAAIWNETSYISVRFGNVLGSRGSVVPIFRKQITQGGPVTVTHPEMTRFFMTIPEAVRLVLQASAVGQSGQLYLLDMGEPVKVVDLAKDMIRLCGLEPGTDVEIRFTGIRPGERLHESLTSPLEEIQKTAWRGLSIVRRPEHFTPRELLETVERLQQASIHNSAGDVRTMLCDLVPSMLPRECEDAGSSDSKADVKQDQTTPRTR